MGWFTREYRHSGSRRVYLKALSRSSTWMPLDGIVTRVVLDFIGPCHDVDGARSETRFSGVSVPRSAKFVVALSWDVDGAAQHAETLHGSEASQMRWPVGGAGHGGVHVCLDALCTVANTSPVGLTVKVSPLVVASVRAPPM
jgi:hypothetical protein